MLERNHRFTIMPRILRFIGDGTFETDHMNFLVDASCSSEVLRALQLAIAGIPWDIAYFNQMPRESDTTSSLLGYCIDNGWELTVESVPCPRINLPESYDALLATLPSRFRSKLRSSRRKLETEFNIEFGQYQDPDDLPVALHTLFANHASRWEANGEKGVFVDESKQTLYRALAPRLLDRGWLRFFYLKINGQVAAQQFCFGHDRTTLLLQEGFDFSWAPHNVGNTLRGMVLEYLIVSGGGVYDFLAGSSRNKSNWSDAQKDDLRIAFHRGSRGLPWHYTKKACLRARAYARPILDRIH